MERLSWIIGVGLKYNHMYPYKRETEGNLTQTEKEKALGPQRQKRVMQPPAKECRPAPETGRGKERILPLKPAERVQLCQLIDFSPVNTGLAFADCKAMRE